MTANEVQDEPTYAVVRNAAGQYSIWPEGKALPLGWEAVSKTGPKDECLKYIGEVWTDMRPQR